MGNNKKARKPKPGQKVAIYCRFANEPQENKTAIYCRTASTHPNDFIGHALP